MRFCWYYIKNIFIGHKSLCIVERKERKKHVCTHYINHKHRKIAHSIFIVIWQLNISSSCSIINWVWIVNTLNGRDESVNKICKSHKMVINNSIFFYLFLFVRNQMTNKQTKKNIWFSLVCAFFPCLAMDFVVQSCITNTFDTFFSLFLLSLSYNMINDILIYS